MPDQIIASESKLYFEDFTPGSRFTSSTIQVSEKDIIDFASVFDPQPSHTDREKAEASFFKELVASGWHTAALTMKLLTTGMKPIWSGIVGAGADELRWPNAVRRGDSIHLRCEVIEARLLKTKPGVGLVRLRVEALNQNNAPVLTLIPSMFIFTRASQITLPAA